MTDTERPILARTRHQLLPDKSRAVSRLFVPGQGALLADSVGLALLVVLENLQPAERLAFVLHDMFAVPYDQIAPIIDRSPAATRQIASRARRRVQGAPTTPDPDLAAQRKVVDAFLAAARRGDFDALLNLLDPDVTFHADTGTDRARARPLLAGAREVAAEVAAQGPRFAASCHPALVNGAVGLIVRPPPPSSALPPSP